MSDLSKLLAEVMHKALDDVDDGWHLKCLEPDEDGRASGCSKAWGARRMLEEDVAPAVIARLAGEVAREALRVRREDWPAKVGIEYVNGFEDAAGWIERQAAIAPTAEGSAEGGTSKDSGSSDVPTEGGAHP